MRRRGLLGGIAATAFATSAFGAISTPPSLISGIGDAGTARQKLGVVGDNAGMLDVTPYGVLADGMSGYYAGTFTSAQTTFSMSTMTASVTVANTGGQAVISYPSTTSLPSPQPHDIGTLMHVPGAGTSGGDFVSPIVSFTSSGTVITVTLRDPAPTTFATTSTALTWPCFASPSWSTGNPAYSSAATDIGKWIRISEGQTWKAGSTLSATVHKYQAPVFGTIASITAPNAITMAFPTGQADPGFTWPTGLGFGFTVAALSGVQVDWGTDNTAALLAATTAAQNAGITDLYFPGSSSQIVFAFGMYTLDTSVLTPFAGVQATFPATIFTGAGSSATSLNYRALFYNNRYLSDGVRSRFFAYTGAEMQKSICPRSVYSRPVMHQKIKGTRHLPRLASMTPGASATVASWSASIFSVNPSGGGQSMTADPIQVFLQALRDANRGRLSFWKNNRSIGGQWMSALDGIPPSFPVGTWYANHSNSWFTYIDPMPNQAGSNVHPDLVLLFEDGSNPRWFESVASLMSIIKKIAGITALNGHAPDVLMANCRSGSHMGNVNTGASFNGGNWPSFLEGEENASTLLETFAEVQGIGFLDLYHPSCLVHDGWSPRHLQLQRVASPPSMSTVAPRVPYDLRYQRVRDYSIWLQIIATSGANAFTTGGAAVGTLRFKLSPHMNNDFIIGVDNATGNFAVMATTFGRWMSDTVTLNTSTGVLTGAGTGQRTAASVTYFEAGAVNITAGSPAFVQSDWNTPVLFSNGGLGGIPYVTSVAEVYTNNLIDVADHLQYNAGGGGGTVTGTLTIGGAIFAQKDADAQLDIVIFQGTTVLAGKITGYTSTGQVTTNITGTTITAQTAQIFVGHLSVPWTVTGQNIASEAGANPTIIFSKTYNRIDVGYIAGPVASNSQILGDFWAGDVAIWGGAYCPKVFVTAAGPCNLAASNVRIDKKMLFTPLLTDVEFWGHSTSDYDDGGGGVHPTQRHTELVDEYTLSFQDLSVV